MNKRHTFRKLVFTLVTMNVVFSAEVHASNSPQFEKPVSLQIGNLSRWKNSPEALAIQQSLQALIKPRTKYPRIAEPFENFKRYLDLYKTPFLVLDAEDGHFGGFFALIVFKDYPKVLSLWVYEIEKNVFEIREIEPLQVTLNKIIMSELEDKRITPFWVAP